ncbi:traB domain-containing protein-like [Papaver somniferum]|uniref:traB domain-containing protein-like n=1 Tax=Papaver somniferum TaxID=3469 RepID=UPI000E6F6DEF|nr:traB domain-containing protein-like [Papaver somniferum]
MSAILTNFGERYDDDDTSHYQHGIPGIPTDGKVVLLKNSKLKSNVYLVGTNHMSKESADTVKKVINYVRPNAVAIELCEQRADLKNSETEDVNLFKVFCNCMLRPGKLPMKIHLFAEACWKLRLQAACIDSGLEFKVAMQEASKIRARCFFIDEDIDVTYEKMSKVFSWVLLWEHLFAEVDYTRASLREDKANEKKQYPEFMKVVDDDREKFMFEKIRTIRKKKLW